MVLTFLRATGRGNDVIIPGQRNVAGRHVEHPVARRRARQGFHFADGDAYIGLRADAR